MPNDPSLGEIARRLDRIDEALQQLALRVVSTDLYQRDRAEIERRLAEVERDIEAERQARKAADKDLRDEQERHRDRQGTSWRQAVYAGLIPGALLMLTFIWQIRTGTGK